MSDPESVGIGTKPGIDPSNCGSMFLPINNTELDPPNYGSAQAFYDISKDFMGSITGELNDNMKQKILYWAEQNLTMQELVNDMTSDKSSVKILLVVGVAVSLACFVAGVVLLLHRFLKWKRRFAKPGERTPWKPLVLALVFLVVSSVFVITGVFLNIGAAADVNEQFEELPGKTRIIMSNMASVIVRLNTEYDCLDGDMNQTISEFVTGIQQITNDVRETKMDPFDIDPTKINRILSALEGITSDCRQYIPITKRQTQISILSRALNASIFFTKLVTAVKSGAYNETRKKEHDATKQKLASILQSVVQEAVDSKSSLASFLQTLAKSSKEFYNDFKSTEERVIRYANSASQSWHDISWMSLVALVVLLPSVLILIAAIVALAVRLRNSQTLAYERSQFSNTLSKTFYFTAVAILLTLWIVLIISSTFMFITSPAAPLCLSMQNSATPKLTAELILAIDSRTYENTTIARVLPTCLSGSNLYILLADNTTLSNAIDIEEFNDLALRFSDALIDLDQSQHELDYTEALRAIQDLKVHVNKIPAVKESGTGVRLQGDVATVLHDLPSSAEDFSQLKMQGQSTLESIKKNQNKVVAAISNLHHFVEGNASSCTDLFEQFRNLERLGCDGILPPLQGTWTSLGFASLFLIIGAVGLLHAVLVLARLKPPNLSECDMDPTQRSPRKVTQRKKSSRSSSDNEYAPLADDLSLRDLEEYQSPPGRSDAEVAKNPPKGMPFPMAPRKRQSESQTKKTSKAARSKRAKDETESQRDQNSKKSSKSEKKALLRPPSAKTNITIVLDKDSTDGSTDDTCSRIGPKSLQ